MNEQQIVARYLQEWDGVAQWKSSLEAALRDARATMEQGTALWLATLGYLIVLEQVGSRLARASTQFPDRSGRGKRFRAGALEFSNDPGDQRLAGVLWALRCALAHEYGLMSEQKHIFMLTRTSTLVVYPQESWDGSTEKAKTLDHQTIISVRAVGEYVEDLVANARAESAAGNVFLAPGAKLDEIELFGGLFSG